MRRPLMIITALMLPLLSAACGMGDDSANIGGLTPDEASQLNNAAEMLDASADDMALPPENTPAPNSSAP